MKTRLDRLLAERGLVESRGKSPGAHHGGRGAGERPEGRQSRARWWRATPHSNWPRGFPTSAAADSSWRRRWSISRIQVTGLACLDVGSSTGGFTDVLLQAGAERVHAVDVGAGQLAWKLRSDPRVRLHEGLNARGLRFEDIGERVGFAACDVSFISVTLILPAAGAPAAAGRANGYTGQAAV